MGEKAGAGSGSTKLSELQEKAKNLAAKLSECWPLYNGTVNVQYLTCGKANCGCRTDKSRRHGPYTTWSTKVKGKTVNRRLTEEEAEVITEWIENRRRLHRTVKELTELSRKMLPLVVAKLGEEE